MSDRDNITLPREAVEKIHEAWSSEVYPPAASTEWYDIMDALRTALAAEKPKPEPVAWLSRDEARLALWKAINSREFGNPTDDKLILDHLRKQGLWIGKVTSPALAAEQEKKTPAWWRDGLAATLMREGVNKHRAREIAVGYWEAYCQIPGNKEDET